jgi:hypothetical protein
VVESLLCSEIPVSSRQSLTKYTVMQYYCVLCVIRQFRRPQDRMLIPLHSLQCSHRMSYLDRAARVQISVSGVAPHGSLRAAHDRTCYVWVDGVIGGELTLPYAGNCSDLMNEDLSISPHCVS